MKFEFFIPEKDFNKKNLRLPKDKNYGDDFFIDKKYSGRIGSNISSKNISLLFLTIFICLLRMLGQP